VSKPDIVMKKDIYICQKHYSKCYYQSLALCN